MPEGSQKRHFSLAKTGLTRFPGLCLFVMVLQIFGTALVPSPCGVWVIIHSQLHAFDRFAILSIPVASEIHES